MENIKFERKERKKKSGLLFGVGLIIFVVFFLFDRIILGGHVHPITLMITVALLVVSGHSIYHRFFTGVFFPLAFVYIINYNTIGIGRFTQGAALLVAVCLSVGVSMIYSSINKKQEKSYNDHPERFCEISIDDSKHVRCTAFFTGISKKVVSEELKTVEVICNFSGAVIDLTEAAVPSGKLDLNIIAKLGGVELYIPQSWTVVDNTTKYIAGITDDKKTKSCCTEPGKEPQIKSENVVVTMTGELKVSGVSIIKICGE